MHDIVTITHVGHMCSCVYSSFWFKRTILYKVNFSIKCKKLILIKMGGGLLAEGYDERP